MKTTVTAAGRDSAMGRSAGAVMVSTVIPTYNRARVIGECVESVLAQVYRDFEIIIVDDGSTDGTRKSLAPLVDGTQVRYIHQERAGAGAARNRGVAVSRGALIAFLDSDDLWKPGKLLADVEFLSLNPEADAVFSDVEKQEGATTVPSLARRFSRFPKLIADRDCSKGVLLSQRDMFLCLLQELPVKTPTVTMRKEAFESVGGFDENIVSGQDWELFLRFSKTHTYGYIDQAQSIVRMSEDSLHISSGVSGLMRMWDMLLEERSLLEGDGEAQAAASRGVSKRCKYLAWHHLKNGERRAGIDAYLRGFVDSGDFGLLARAIANMLPEGVLRRARRFRRWEE